MIVKTRNSTYEIDHEKKLIRLTESTNPPYYRFEPRGEWKPFHAADIFYNCLYIQWDAEGYHTTHTSTILSTNE